MTRTPEQLRAAIDRRTQPGTNDCLIWTGAIDSDGYPKIVNGKTPNGYGKIVPAHRVNWELVNGPIPDGYELARTLECPNRRCIEPTHLRLVNTGHAGREAYGRTPAATHFQCGHSRAEHGRARSDGQFQCYTCDLERNRERCRRWRERHPDRVAAYRQKLTAKQTGLAA